MIKIHYLVFFLTNFVVEHLSNIGFFNQKCCVASTSASLIQEVVEQRDASIPKETLLKELLPDASVLNVTDDEPGITENYTASQLVLSTEQVIKAYLKRAGIAHQLTNCATEFLGEEALVRAKYLDIEF